MQKDDRRPFTYIVGWTKANIYYIGVKHAKGCEPEDLGATYFTSSKKIRAIWAYIEPDFKCIYPFDTADEALEFEEVLQREFDVLKSKQFANKQIGGKCFRTSTAGMPKSAKTKAKLSAANKGKKPSESTRKKLREATERNKELRRWNAKNRPPIRLETRLKLSQSLKGKPAWNKGIPMTENAKLLASEKLSKAIQTPAGVFKSKKLAAEFYGISPQAMSCRMKHNPTKYFYI